MPVEHLNGLCKTRRQQFLCQKIAIALHQGELNNLCPAVTQIRLTVKLQQSFAQDFNATLTVPVMGFQHLREGRRCPGKRQMYWP